MSRSLDATIKQVYQEAFIQQGAFDNARHHKQLNELIARTRNPDTAPLALPGHVGQQAVEVTPGEMRQLEQARDIALVTKLLLTASNQRLAVHSTMGASYLAQRYAETTLRHLSGRSPTAQAINAIVLGVGICDQHAYVAFEIARSLDLTAAVCSDNKKRHTYTLLHPETDNPTVIDAWTDFVTVSRLSEYRCNVDQTIIAHHKDAPVPPAFNLSSILHARAMLWDRLGPNGVADQLLEDKRQELGISDKHLDRLMLKQGVMRYTSISVEGLPSAQRADIETRLNRVRDRTVRAVLREAARSRALTTPIEVSGTIKSRLMQSGTPDEDRLADTTAREEVLRRARIEAETALKNKLALPAGSQASQTAAKKMTVEVSCTEQVGDATARATAIMTAHARTKPYLWDTRFHASVNAYHLDGREAQRFDCVPPGQAASIVAAAAEADFEPTTSEEISARLSGRMPARLIRVLNQIEQGVKDGANKVSRKPAFVTPAALQQAADNAVRDALGSLPGLLSDSAVKQDQICQILTAIEGRLDDVSRECMNEVILALARQSSNFEGQASLQCRDIVRRWSRHVDQEMRDEVLRSLQ